MPRELGALPHELMVDAIMGSFVKITPLVAEAIVKNGLGDLINDGGMARVGWRRAALYELSTDLLVDLYLSLKNSKVPNVLS